MEQQDAFEEFPASIEFIPCLPLPVLYLLEFMHSGSMSGCLILS